MKYITLLLVTVVLTATANSQISNNGQLYLSRSFNMDTIEELNALTAAGNITITGTGKKEARINIYVRSLNGKRDILAPEEIERRMKEFYRINIKDENHRLVVHAVRTTAEMDWRKQLILSLEIIIPTDIVVEASAPNGNISVSHLRGSASLLSNSGNFYLNNMEGITTASTSGGNIFSEDCSGRLQLSTEGGLIHLTGINGKVHANAPGGSVSAIQ